MKFILTNGRPNQTGSISWGTLRNEDLIPKFLDELIYCGVGVDNLSQEWANIKINNQQNSEDADWLLEDIMLRLMGLAPEGIVFGTTLGDGADFGWWQYDDDDDDNAGEDNETNPTGTLINRPQDDIEFIGLLLDLCLQKGIDTQEYVDSANKAQSLPYNSVYRAIDIESIINYLQEELDEVSPSGFYFGEYPDNALCFGYYPKSH